MSSQNNFETILSRLDDTTAANIRYDLSKLESEEDRTSYQTFVVDSFYKENLEAIPFYPELYKEEIDNIHERISYQKHKRVVRKGRRCKICGGTNTFEDEKRKGGGDEYIPSRVQCYDCGKAYYI